MISVLVSKFLLVCPTGLPNFNKAYVVFLELLLEVFKMVLKGDITSPEQVFEKILKPIYNKRGWQLMRLYKQFFEKPADRTPQQLQFISTMTSLLEDYHSTKILEWQKKQNEEYFSGVD